MSQNSSFETLVTIRRLTLAVPLFGLAGSAAELLLIGQACGFKD